MFHRADAGRGAGPALPILTLIMPVPKGLPPLVSLAISLNQGDRSRASTSLPKSFAMTASAMSVPAETPDDVANGPSSTQRAAVTQSTLSLWLRASWK